MKKYYLHNGTAPVGPYDLNDLKLKCLNKETPVWYEGLESWIFAGQIPELRDILSPISPPPLYRNEPTGLSNPQKESIKRLSLIIGIAAISITFFITLVFINREIGGNNIPVVQPPQTYRQKVMTVEEVERWHPDRFLKVEGEYSKSLFGGKLKIHGTILNKATVVSYKDAVVRVTFYDKTNTALSHVDYTINDSFPPYKEVVFEMKVENHESVADLKYTIVKAKAY